MPSAPSAERNEGATPHRESVAKRLLIVLDFQQKKFELYPKKSAIIKNGDKFLLFHRIKPGHDYFIFPGGGVEEGETIEEALKREVKEELNISVGNFKKLFVVDNIYAPAWATIHPGQKQVYYFYMVEDYIGTPELSGPEKLQANDQNEYIFAWLSLDEISQLDNVVPKEGAAMFLKFGMNNSLN